MPRKAIFFQPMGGSRFMRTGREKAVSFSQKVCYDEAKIYRPNWCNFCTS